MEEEKKLKIVISPNSNYSEVVDSIADALEAGVIIENTLQDGFQIQDVLNALQVQPIVQEIVNDVPVFVEQFLKLNGDTAKAAVLEARERLVAQGRPIGKVTNWITNALFVLANNYAFAINSYQQGQAQFMLWQTLINGGDVFPPELGV